jgi:hypothetical protein
VVSLPLSMGLEETHWMGCWSLLYLDHLTPRESPMSPLISRLSGTHRADVNVLEGKKSFFSCLDSNPGSPTL